MISKFIVRLRRTADPYLATESHFSRFTAPLFRISTIADTLSEMGHPLDYTLRTFDTPEVCDGFSEDVSLGSEHPVTDIAVTA